MMFMTCEPPSPRPPRPPPIREASAAEFGGFDLVDYVQVHTLLLLLGHDQGRNDLICRSTWNRIR